MILANIIMGVLKFVLCQKKCMNPYSPLFWFNSNATRAKVFSSKSLKDELPRETNAIPQAIVQKRKFHKIGGL